MKNHETDVLIVGAGLTGLCLATILSNFFDRITITDKNRINQKMMQTNDIRTTAISEGSKKILEGFRLWNNIKNYAQPIKKIKIFDRHQLNKIDFTNPKRNENLGYIVENKYMKKSFFKKIIINKRINIIHKFNVKSLDSEESNIKIFSDNIKIKAKLVIAADGKFSQIRKLAKISYYKKEYRHSAIAINLSHTKSHNNTAYEIFNKSGPLAILPMLKNNTAKNRSFIVWSCSKDFAKQFDKLDKEYAISILNENIGKYIGEIKNIIGQKIFNLSAHINKSFYDDRLIFIGDSAHSIHPIAGQGWNLGLRDINSLYELLKENSELGLDPGNPTTLKQYNSKRFFDAYSLYQITDKLNSIFLLENFLTRKLRQFGIDLIDSNKALKNVISTYAMGKKLKLSNFFKL